MKDKSEVIDMLSSSNLTVVESNPKVPAVAEEKAASNDSERLELAKKNIEAMVIKGGKVLDEMHELASNTEHPRAFEAYSSMFKTIIDANRTLASLATSSVAKVGQESSNSDDGAPKAHVIITSPADMQRMIRGEDTDSD